MSYTFRPETGENDVTVTYNAGIESRRAGTGTPLSLWDVFATFWRFSTRPGIEKTVNH